MAGTIHVDEMVRWTGGSVAFVAIIERIRRSLADKGCKDTLIAFDSVDSGFDFITLDELTAINFTEFYQSCKSELNRCEHDEDATSELPAGYRDGILEKWHELLAMLERDSRIETAEKPCQDQELNDGGKETASGTE